MTKNTQLPEGITPGYGVAGRMDADAELRRRLIEAERALDAWKPDGTHRQYTFADLLYLQRPVDEAEFSEVYDDTAVRREQLRLDIERLSRWDWKWSIKVYLIALSATILALYVLKEILLGL